jgi:hypothetical protein
LDLGDEQAEELAAYSLELVTQIVEPYEDV